MAVKIEADKPGKLSLDIALDSYFKDKIIYSPDGIILDGTWKGPLPEKNWLIGDVEGEGLKFRTALKTVVSGGKSAAAQDKLSVSDANSVVIILTASTSYVNYNDIGADPAARCNKILANVADKDYKALRTSHIDDFNGLMGRMHLTVGDPKDNEKPTDIRLKAMREGHEDANLEALVFQFGRYALASSSRAGGQPANLQAIWNENLSPNWGSKYTININTEMNYWPTEVCNLPECHQPLFDMLEDISVTGVKTAKTYYNRDGWVAHHNLDLWRGTAPVDAARFGMWPVGGAWLCQDIWEHYAYTLDLDFLRKYYPVMKGAAVFLSGLLEPHPRLGYLVTPFSMSPEHGFIYGKDKSGQELTGYVSPAPTMDVAIMRELFPHCIEAAKLLNIDADFAGSLEEILPKLPPYKVNSRGFVQEWIEDWGSGNQGHNFSTNFPFFPGSSILLHRESDKALVQATNNWMDKRHGGGGFPTSWDICMWSRLERGDKVGQFIRSYVSNSVAGNLHNSGSNQSDATFGFTAGVAESLIQSHDGVITLLPALSTSWPDGSVTGLRARGGYEINISWKNGELVSADLFNINGNKEIAVRYKNKTNSYIVEQEEKITIRGGL
jgi:alpha-L-fucosidase 2